MKQVFDEEIYDIVEKGLLGGGLTKTETLKLYQVPETSKEAAYIRWAGQELSLRAADGKAEIHAQIGPQFHHLPEELQVLLVRRVQFGAQGQIRAS